MGWPVCRSVGGWATSTPASGSASAARESVGRPLLVILCYGYLFEGFRLSRTDADEARRVGDALDATRLRRAGAAYGVGCLAAGAAAWSRAMSCASESADVIARATTSSSTASNRASPSWMASGLPTMTVSTAGTPSARSGRHTADGGVTIGLGPRRAGPLRQRDAP